MKPKRHYRQSSPMVARVARELYFVGRLKQREIGKIFGLRQHSVSRIVSGADVAGGAMKTAALFDIAGVSNENDEWYTPSWMFRAIGVEFDLDPCSPGAPPSSVPAKRHLTKADNGLTAEWHGSVWLNPPFSGKRPWYERLVQHGNGIALMPARTETHDLQTYMTAAHALLFLRGRIYFERGHRPGANGNGAVTTPPFGIVLCAYGEAMAAALLNSDLMGVRAQVLPREAR